MSEAATAEAPAQNTGGPAELSGESVNVEAVESTESAGTTQEKVQGTRATIDAGENKRVRDQNGMYAGKYKSVEDLVEGYKNAESQLGKLKREKRPEAPEEYEVSSEELVDFFKGSEAWEPMTETFREANLTQEQVDAVLGKYYELTTSQPENYEQEIQKLQKEGVIDNVTNFAQKNLTEDEFSVLETMTTTPEQTRLIDKLVKLGAEKNIPAEPGKSKPAASSDELRREARELKSDPNFRMSRSMQKEYTKLMAQAFDMDNG